MVLSAHRNDHTFTEDDGGDYDGPVVEGTTEHGCDDGIDTYYSSETKTLRSYDIDHARQNLTFIP